MSSKSKINTSTVLLVGGVAVVAFAVFGFGSGKTEARQEGKTDRVEIRQGGITERVIYRQEGRTERKDIKWEGKKDVVGIRQEGRTDRLGDRFDFRLGKKELRIARKDERRDDWMKFISGIGERRQERRANFWGMFKR